MQDLLKYRSGDLSPEEMEAISGRLLTAKYDHDRQERWAEELRQQYGVSRQATRSPSRSRRWYWPAGVAASLVLVLSLFYVTYDLTPTYQQLVDEHLTTDFFENRDRLKGDQDIKTLNLQAVDAYNQRDFDTAIKYYAKILASGTVNDEHYFFSGLSNLYAGHFTEASRQLEQVLVVDSASKFREETHWFLALSYLKAADIAAGKKNLLLIRPTEWRYAEAQHLLTTLE